MAVADTINSMKQHIEDAYGIVEEKGGTIPQNKNLENMADSIGSISGGGEMPEIFGKDTSPTASNIYSMFQYSIKSLPKSLLKQLAENVVAKSANGCYRLFSGFDYYDDILDLRDFDTSKSTNMSYMFYRFTNLNGQKIQNNSQILFPENFGENCTNMSYMFDACINLKSIDLSRFKTSKVTNMSYMFRACSSLENIDLSSLDMTKITSLASFLYGCYNLKNIIFPENFGENCTSLSQPFYQVGSQTNNGCIFDLSGLNTQKTNDMTNMFSYSKINSLIVPENFGENCTNMSYMFYITTLPEIFSVSNFNTQNVTNMSGMFQSIKETKHLNLSNLNTSKVTDMSAMLNYLPNTIEEIIFPENFGSACTNMSNMFSNDFNTAAFKNKQLDLSNFNTSKVTNMSAMFRNTNYLALLDLSSFDFTKVTTFSNMFNICGTSCLQSDGAYANGIPYIIVKDATAQNWILTKSNGRPTTWSTANVVIKGSADDPTLGA